ncbi:MAG: DMT family transporter [Vampirovibrionales bacterium]
MFLSSSFFGFVHRRILLEGLRCFSRLWDGLGKRAGAIVATWKNHPALWIAHGAMFLCALTFASIPTVNKLAMQEGCAFLEVAQWRILLSGLVCLVYESVRGSLREDLKQWYQHFTPQGKRSKTPTPQEAQAPPQGYVPWTDRCMMMLLGGTGVALLQYFLSWGLSMTTGIHGLLIMTTVPLITLCLGCFRGQEQLSLPRVMGMLLGFSGVAYLLLSQSPTHVAQHHHLMLFGDALIICNALLYANYLTQSKPYTQRYAAMTVTMYNYLGVFAFILGYSCLHDLWHVSLPFSIVLPSFSTMVHHAMNASPLALGCLVWMALMGSVVAYVCQNKALQVLSASSVASYAFIQPLLGATIAWLTLGEQLTWHTVGACTFIFAGLYLVQKTALSSSLKKEPVSLATAPSFVSS